MEECSAKAFEKEMNLVHMCDSLESQLKDAHLNLEKALDRINSLEMELREYHEQLSESREEKSKLVVEIDGSQKQLQEFENEFEDIRKSL